MEATVSEPSSRYDLPGFFLLAFAVSWGVWSLPLIEAAGLGTNPLPAAVTRLLGAFGPAIAALVVTAADGRRSVARLLGRFRRWRVPLRWYAIVLFLPAIVSLLATGVSIALGSPVPDFSNPPVRELYPVPPELAGGSLLALFPLVFVQTLLFGSPMGEEIGWRGFALPRLQADATALGASLVLGVAWGLWHLPLFFVPGDPLGQAYPPSVLVGIVADAILFTWVFDNTDGSLLLALLFHASIAVTDLFLSAADPIPFLDAAVTWAIALVVLRTFGPETLARGSRR